MLLTGSVGSSAGITGPGTGAGAVMSSWLNVDLGEKLGGAEVYHPAF